jgi:YihY family inner membrane protein
VSTASVVPETWELSGDDAWRTLRATGRRRLIADSFMRMRAADGFSHARSLAFLTSLVMVQAVIALVGLASALGDGTIADGIVRAIQNAVPGPAGELLTAAVAQAHGAGLAKQYLALIVGLVGAVITGTTSMGQLERGLNRLYGVEQDRPMVHKYGRALLLAITAGSLLLGSFVAIAFGHSIGSDQDHHLIDGVWGVARWPLAFVLLVSAVALLFKVCPRRRQPAWSWLAFGSFVSVLVWFVVTLGLGWFFSVSTSFGDTYGPLAGIVALELWALLSSIGVFFGAAVAAQLEAVRAGNAEPQDPEKVEGSEPSDGSGDVRAPVGAAR